MWEILLVQKCAVLPFHLPESPLATSPLGQWRVGDLLSSLLDGAWWMIVIFTCKHSESACCFTQGHKMRPIVLEQDYIFSKVWTSRTPPREQALPKSVCAQAVAINPLNVLQDEEQLVQHGLFHEWYQAPPGLSWHHCTYRDCSIIPQVKYYLSMLLVSLATV